MEETNISMELTVGAVLEGKVKSITNFGAFIALPENKTGMVHISEIANAYVSDIRQHLTEGQDVKVMVINLDGGNFRPNNNQATRPAPVRAAADAAALERFSVCGSWSGGRPGWRTAWNRTQT